MAKGSDELSRRERQIVDCLFECGEATVADLQERLTDAPSDGALRTMLRILMDKGLVKRRKAGRRHVYAPTASPRITGRAAMRRVVDTFFGGSLSSAVAAHLAGSRRRLDEKDARHIEELLKEIQRMEQERKTGE